MKIEMGFKYVRGFVLQILFGFGMIYSLPATAAPIEYDFNWDIGKLPFEIKMFHAPLSLANRVGEHGELVNMQNMPVLAVIDKKLTIDDSDSAVLYLVIKNTSDKAYHFSVVPHSIEPAEASLGLDFKCLCYGHVYTIKPRSLWYRILRVTHDVRDEKKRAIQLRHKIFETKVRKK